MAKIVRKSSSPSSIKGRFDGDFDVIVAGSGVAGLATALLSCWQGNKVLVLEKASELGGTTRKAAFWYWVPNNAAMRAAGTKDLKKDCIRYMARLSRPEVYNAKAANFGVPEWEYSQYEAIYDNASIATEMLRKKGALEYRHCDFVPDYWAELPEDKAPKGRVLLPKDARETMSDGGEVAIRTMSAAAKRDGVDIRVSHRVQRVVRNSVGEVVGVEVDNEKGKKLRFFARKAVVFCTGGFTHNIELRKNYLAAPVFGGCAARSNEGDFVFIASCGTPTKDRRGKIIFSKFNVVSKSASAKYDCLSCKESELFAFFIVDFNTDDFSDAVPNHPLYAMVDADIDAVPFGGS